MANKTVTVQYEAVVARRGSLTTTVKEKTFKSEQAMEKWFEKNAGNATPIRYSFSE